MAKVPYGGITPALPYLGAYAIDPGGFSAESGFPNKFKGVYSAGARNYLNPGVGFVSDSLRWCCAHLSITGTPPVGVEVEIASSTSSTSAGYGLFVVRYDDDEVIFKLYAKQTVSDILLATGTTRYASDGTGITLRVQTNGSTIEVWLNGSKELEVAATAYWSRTYLVNPNNSAYVFRYWRIGGRGGSSMVDRPGFGLETRILIPAEDYDVKYSTSGNNDYGGRPYAGAEDCALPERGRWENWDDWGSGDHDGEASFNCEQGGASGREASFLGAVGGFTQDVEFATRLAECRTQTALKTVATKTYLKADNGDEDFQNNANIDWASWAPLPVQLWQDPPSGSWSDYMYGSTFNHEDAIRQLSLVIESLGTNEDNDMWTAVALEIGSMSNDPGEEPTENRRRVMAQVV